MGMSVMAPHTHAHLNLIVSGAEGYLTDYEE